MGKKKKSEGDIKLKFHQQTRKEKKGNKVQKSYQVHINGMKKSRKKNFFCVCYFAFVIASIHRCFNGKAEAQTIKETDGEDESERRKENFKSEE